MKKDIKNYINKVILISSLVVTSVFVGIAASIIGMFIGLLIIPNNLGVSNITDNRSKYNFPIQELNYTYTDDFDDTKISNCAIYYIDRKELVFQYGNNIDNDYDGEYIVMYDLDNAEWRKHEEIKLYWIRTVTFKNLTKPRKTDAWFSSMYGLERINNWNLLDTSNVRTMNHMFSYLGVKTIDISHFDTSKVEKMRYMFYGCSNLKELDFSWLSFDSVRDCKGMFGECTSLERWKVKGVQ
ncbi:MAG: BspA family leucine-rich repeat surface protein [Lachnospiraceae bacterium]|nr:BspA family leucine-rich repeat surface protein [Lachnospiraceae bacterium]